MVMATVDGHKGEPGLYRDYRLRQIMKESTTASVNDSRSLATV
jgi:hypothetical protein